MGSIPSYLKPELVVAVAIVAGAIVLGCAQATKPRQSLTQDTPTAARGSSSTGKRGKKKKSTLQPETNEPSTATTTTTTRKPIPTEFAKLIPGEFEYEPVQDLDGPGPKPKKGKKKGKSAAAKQDGVLAPTSPVADRSDHSPEPSSSAVKTRRQSTPSQLHSSKSAASVDTDGSWTRVESRRQKAKQGILSSSTEGQPSPDLTTSDAGVTTSVTTGTSSPVAERTEEESFVDAEITGARRKTLAEKMLPKPRKTGVEECVFTSRGRRRYLLID
jgi:hypothetical protein